MWSRTRPEDELPAGDAGHIVLGVIGDLHGELYHLKKVIDYLSTIEISGVLLVGDFGTLQYEQRRWGDSDAKPFLIQELSVILSLLGRLKVPIAWIPGDHDYRDLDLEGNCDRKIALIEGVRIYGIGGSGPGRLDQCGRVCLRRRRRTPPEEVLFGGGE